LKEAWRKRRYKAAFVAKLSDAESEACETQVWLEFALKCSYVEEELAHSVARLPISSISPSKNEGIGLKPGDRRKALGTREAGKMGKNGCSTRVKTEGKIGGVTQTAS